MSASAISVENLSKKYRLGAARHDTLRDQVWHALRAPFGRAVTPPDDTEFWALRNVSFEVKPGEVLGIIGRNGAGKSTLLKILSRITEPTNGRISIRGRIASLLEVGTGFHPELSGRENIFLNGAILGMSRQEIRGKFDEIVAFAEVERFLDTAVKHYSSGMYVRLAFAVAAHLEPEILIVDEVLAVGDMAFQQKCLGKIEKIAGSDGRTVLLVSHNMVSIQQLCHRVLRLNAGQVAGQGEPLAEIQSYLATTTATSVDPVCDLSNASRALEPRGGATFRSAQLLTSAASTPWKLPFHSPLRIRLQFDVNTELPPFEIGVGVFNLHGQEIISTLSSWEGPISAPRRGTYWLEVDFGTVDLSLGVYRFGIGVKSDRGLEDYLPEAFEVEVIPSETSALPNLNTIRGAIAKRAHFAFSPASREHT
jgi:lipopolysaccharide transport system ATP-binding protein